MRPVVSLGVGPAAVLLATAALADPLSYSDASGDVIFYGQLSPTYLGFDDGEESFGNLADNDISNSLVGFILDWRIGAGVGLRFNLEASIGAPQSSAFSQGFEPIWEWDKTDLRHFELILDTAFGKLSAGQGSMATDGTPEQDLSGTSLAGYVSRSDTAGGYFLRQSSGDLSDINIGSAFMDYNGGRQFRVRYDTPEYSGFSAAAAYGVDILTEGDDNDYYDIAVNYGGELGATTVAASLGWSWVHDPDTGDTTNRRLGSISVLHKPSGLNATVAAGAEPDAGSYVYGKLGWIGDVLAVGSTAVAVDYYNGEDLGMDGSSSRSWGVEAVQSFDKAKIDAYVGWISYAYDDDAASYRDASSTMVGMRWTF
ncbi:porin [Tropicimonas sp. IMCC34043]|uniref:porin n=1 Tax=Tropicimonas sp. IMCC34043 TaxID=2248760 RepID=UPI001300837B|nr:porin [Tropicimonas sp. IMCC34043]